MAILRAASLPKGPQECERKEEGPGEKVAEKHGNEEEGPSLGTKSNRAEAPDIFSQEKIENRRPAHLHTQ